MKGRSILNIYFHDVASRVYVPVHAHVLYMLDIETRTGVIFRKVAWCWWNKWTEVFASVLKVYGRIHEIMEVNGRILTTCAR